MEYIASTINSLEDVAIKEIKELLKARAVKVSEGRIKFKAKNISKLKNAMSLTAVYSLIARFKFKDEKEIYSKLNKIRFKIKGPFVVRCSRIGSHNFKSNDIEKNVGEIIYTQGFKVNLENPNTVVYADIMDDNLFLGELIAANMQKRGYRIRLATSTLNPCIAYAMLRLANIKKTDTLVDPLCSDGIILIEAGLYGLKKLYGLDDSSNNIKNAAINAKFAKLKINFSKNSVDWLDTLFKKEGIDRIITVMPILSRHADKEAVEKVHKEVFHQARYALKKKGCMVLLAADDLSKYAKQDGFKIALERKLRIAERDYKLQRYAIA